MYVVCSMYVCMYVYICIYKYMHLRHDAEEASVASVASVWSVYLFFKFNFFQFGRCDTMLKKSLTHTRLVYLLFTFIFIFHSAGAHLRHDAEEALERI